MILENHAMIYKAKCNTSETLWLKFSFINEV